MIYIIKKDWDLISNDYKGVWTEEVMKFNANVPESYLGKKNVLGGCLGGKIGTLLTEGIHFEII
jgi:hypothetical protein